VAPDVEGRTRRARKNQGACSHQASPWRCPGGYIRRLSGSKLRVVAAKLVLWRQSLERPIASLLRGYPEDDFTSAADAS
jgi:hypothetical protein